MTEEQRGERRCEKREKEKRRWRVRKLRKETNGIDWVEEGENVTVLVEE